MQANLEELNQDKQFLRSFEQFVAAYQELTVQQMRQRREAITNSRRFTHGLLDIFIDLKHSMKQLKAEDDDTPPAVSFTTLQKNDKQVAVFLSFSSRFTAALNRKVFAHFANYIAQQQDSFDIVLVGETSQNLFQERFPEVTKEPTVFRLSERDLSDEKLLPLTKHILQYERVVVFNPFFASLVEQTPQITNLTGDISLDNQEIALTERAKRQFLYEPHGKEILNFFEIQIFLSLLKQTVKETLLAILGARITTLEGTQEQIDTDINKIQLRYLKAQRKLHNKKQHQRLASMQLW